MQQHQGMARAASIASIKQRRTRWRYAYQARRDAASKHGIINQWRKTWREKAAAA